MQILYVYEPAYETGGQFWPHVHIRIIASLVLLQVCFIGVFSVKGLGRGSFIAIPLPILTLLFNEHCRHRFFPAFRHFNMEVSHVNFMKKRLVFQGSNDLTEYIWKCISWAYSDGYEASSSSKWMVCLYMKLLSVLFQDTRWWKSVCFLDEGMLKTFSLHQWIHEMHTFWFLNNQEP
jgi:hypothetical protein